MAARLDGKVCVITGAASGIGAEAARLFAAEGARVVGVDLEPGSEGELALQADVADEEQVRGMYARAREELGRIDVLFNNAGISPADDASVLETSLEAWQRVQDVNLRGVFLCCKHGIPHLLNNDPPGRRVGDQHGLVRRRDGRRRLAGLLHRVEGGSAVAVAGARGGVRAARGAGQRALPGAGEHAAARRPLRLEPEKAARRLVHVPMGRFAEPREVAQAALFLASDESSYVTASTFLVDGGLSAAYLTPE